MASIVTPETTMPAGSVPPGSIPVGSTAGPPGPDDLSLSGADWQSQLKLRHRESVAVISGADRRPMLYDSTTGRYTGITPMGARIMSLLDGRYTCSELTDALSSLKPQQAERVRRDVPTFIGELRQAGVLTAEPLPVAGAARLNRLPTRELMIRFPLAHDLGSRVAPWGAALRRVPLRLLVGVLLAVPLAGLALAVDALAGSGRLHAPALWPVALVVLLIQVACHETSHAVACAYHRIRVREAGLGLMFGFIPIAYVDRTDAYRVHSRSGRAAIALAGPLSDTVWLGANAVVVMTVHGGVGQAAHILLVVQVIMLAANFNPLLPTDGYHALEAGIGAVNLRGRALAYLLHLVTRQPLPSRLARSGRRTRVGYLGYALVSGVYTIALAASVLVQVVRLVLRLL